jgi:hypothetical protein
VQRYKLNFKFSHFFNNKCGSWPILDVAVGRFLMWQLAVSRLVIWPDEQSINFTQMVDGTPEESSIPKDIIVEIYKVVGNYRRQ